MFLDKGYIFVTVALCSMCTSRVVVTDSASEWDCYVAKTTKGFYIVTAGTLSSKRM